MLTNRALRDMLGYSEAELREKTWAELTHPDDLAADMEQLEHLLSGRIEGYHLEKRFMRKDGAIVHTMLSVSAVRKEDGSVDYVLAQLQDISAGKRIEQAAKNEREQLLAVLDGIEDVIYVADPETYELLHVNEAFSKSWGQNIIGEKCYRALQGREEPCPFCTNHIIFGEGMGTPYVWEFQNELTRRWYRCFGQSHPLGGRALGALRDRRGYHRSQAGPSRPGRAGSQVPQSCRKYQRLGVGSGRECPGTPLRARA